jgi:cytochrome c553
MRPAHGLVVPGKETHVIRQIIAPRRHLGGSRRKPILAALALALGLLGAGAVGADPGGRAEQIVGERCHLCHGRDGQSASAVYPRLAGQNAEYVAKQLADFKSGKRKSETMKPQAESLSEEEMQALGAFFATKKPAARPAKDADLVAVGRYLFAQGNRFSGVPACSTCHGPRAAGTPQLPRLAGQHPRYIEDQLAQFNKRERTNDNAVMHTIASKLTELETHALAEYLATLE